MDNKLRIDILKSKGKRGLADYNRINRNPFASMNTGTRIHIDKRFRDPKHKNRIYKEGNE